MENDKLVRLSGVLNVIEHTGNSMSGWLWEELHEDIQSLPAVDAVEVKHGEWIDVGSGQLCSVCGEFQPGHDNYRFYCAKCGAKMDGDA